MIGGFSYAISQFDRATQAERQTGSAIKPLRLSRRARSRLHAVDDGARCAVRGRSGAGLAEMESRPTTSTISPGRCRCASGLEESPQPGHRAGRHHHRSRRGRANIVERFGILDHMPHENSFDADRRRRDHAAPAHHRLCDAGQWRQAHHARPSSTACRTATATPSTAPTTALATAAATSTGTARPPPELARHARADRRSAQRLSGSSP